MLSVLSLSPSYTLPSAGAPSSARRTPVSRPPRMAADGAPKIVVTGLGVVSALGSGDEFWEKITAGECGIDEVTGFDASRFPTTIGAECKDFDPAPWFDNKKSVKSTDRYTHLAMAASKMAVADSAIDLEKTDSWRFGCIIGSAFGGMDTFEKQALALDKGKKVSPFMVPAILGNTAAGMVGIELGPQGPNFGVASACAAGSHAIGEAVRHMKEGAADVMLCGGAEAAMTPLSYAGFCAMKAMNSKFNDSPKKASRPFDADRAGFVMGEGAGVLLLETEEHAKVSARARLAHRRRSSPVPRDGPDLSHTPPPHAQARGAKIYCELAGYAATCDAHHITTPHPEGAGLSTCLANALDAAGVAPSDVEYINAHGTSTAYNDKFETMAIKTVFGEHAHKLAVSSTKSMTGHTLGAAGGIEAAICAKVMETGTLPPTINYETADPECDLNYVPNVAQKLDAPPKAAISDNLGFGGHNAALVFKAYAP